MNSLMKGLSLLGAYFISFVFLPLNDKNNFDKVFTSSNIIEEKSDTNIKFDYLKEDNTDNYYDDFVGEWIKENVNYKNNDYLLTFDGAKIEDNVSVELNGKKYFGELYIYIANGFIEINGENKKVEIEIDLIVENGIPNVVYSDGYLYKD